MLKVGYKITIDGPSGAGKGSVAKGLSEKLDILNIDTGAMYRTLALYCIQNNVNVDNVNDVINVLSDVDIYLKNEDGVVSAYLNDLNVSSKIRTEQVGFVAAKVSSILPVREYMRQKQRAMTGTQNVVAEGRDIGSVVFPDADLKIFLTADVETRAQRRYKDMLEKNKEITYESVLEYIIQRDELDRTRKISPLVKTEDMIEIDNTNMSKEEVVEKVLELIKEKGLV